MTTITVEELHERLASGEKINLIDVREPHENAEFNIGGILLPLGKIQVMQIDDIEDFKTEEVICYCRSGQRSMMAAVMLETFGFTDVKNLSGGMLGWKEKYGG
ncbi:MAG: rhodanese-like domain-containing protein [Chitinophagaceae bacterium]|nr:rhodanese-like domain-containing protein [Chitinophagaceae bacterium]